MMYHFNIYFYIIKYKNLDLDFEILKIENET